MARKKTFTASVRDAVIAGIVRGVTELVTDHVKDLHDRVLRVGDYDPTPDKQTAITIAANGEGSEANADN